MQHMMHSNKFLLTDKNFRKVEGGKYRPVDEPLRVICLVRAYVRGLGGRVSGEGDRVRVGGVRARPVGGEGGGVGKLARERMITSESISYNAWEARSESE